MTNIQKLNSRQWESKTTFTNIRVCPIFFLSCLVCWDNALHALIHFTRENLFTNANAIILRMCNILNFTYHKFQGRR
jgi:hypothetical protein